MTPDEVNALEERVGKGITWLLDHDPVGAYHTWWQAGLTPTSPLPAHEATPEVKVEWADYYRYRQLWEQLERRLASAQARDMHHPPTILPWKPAPARE